MSGRFCVDCVHMRVPAGPGGFRPYCDRPMPSEPPCLVTGQVPTSRMYCVREREPIEQPGWLARLFGIQAEQRCGPEASFFKPKEGRPK